MFNFLKKKIKPFEVLDICHTTDNAKRNALVNLAKTDNAYIFLCWFSETKSLLEEQFALEGIDLKRLQLAERFVGHSISDNKKLMVEHHPNRRKEELFFEGLNVSKIEIYNSLNEAIFQSANVSSIVDLMRKLGMSDEEPIQHAMISASIKKVQEKFDNVTSDFVNAHSQAEWIRKNSSNV